jgi:tripartite-type tricarboxylate transporter receptor subunit TctC
LTTRRFALSACAVLLAAALPLHGHAQAQAGASTRLIVPYPAGGPTDVVARVIAQPIAEELGRSVVVENRAGASGTIGAGVVARAAPDGSTLMLNTSIQVILPHLMKLPYDSSKDFTPIAQVNSIPFILVVNKDLPFKTVAELVAYAKANPGKLNYATNSAGSASHVAAEQFKKIAGISLTHVPYKGSAPALTDLVGGQVQLMFEQGPSVLPFLQNGRLRALAVTSTARTAIAPDVPTFAETGYPSFVYSNWQGIWAPGGMSPAAAEQLAAAVRRALQKPAVRQRLQELGTEPSTLAGADFQKFAQQQDELVGAIVQQAQIKLD